MKKITYVLVLIITLTVALSGNCFAVEVTPTVSISSESGLREGTIDVNVSIDTIPANWNSYELEINFDTSVLTVNDIANGNIFDSITKNFNNTNGKINASSAQVAVVTSGDIICTISFTINSDSTIGESLLTYEPDMLFLSDKFFEEISVNESNGSVTVNITQAQAIGYINSAADASAVKTALETYSTELGLTMTDYDSLTADSKLAVATYVYNDGADYANAAAIQTAFNNSVAEQKQAEAEQAALTAVNSAIVGTIGDVLSSNNDALGLSLSDGSDFAGLNDKSPVYQALVDKNFGTIEAIKTAFNTAVGAQKAIEEEAAAIQIAIDAVNGANESGMAQVLNDNNDVLGLDISDGSDFDGLNDKSSVYQALVGKNFGTIAEIKTAFNIAVGAQKTVEEEAAAIQAAIDAVNGATESGMAQVLNENNDVLCLNLSDGSDFSGLNNKLPVYQALVGKNFATIEAIQTAFISAVNAQQAEEVSITLSGTVTVLDGTLEGTVNVIFIIDGNEYNNKQLTFSGNEANFSEVFGTLITSGEEMKIKVDGYVSSTFTFAESIGDNGSAGSITLELTPGNLDGDSAIDDDDVDEFKKTFNKSIDDTGYNEASDFNNDNKVDVRDLYYIGRYYGTGH